jgi:hypothetical protein
MGTPPRKLTDAELDATFTTPIAVAARPVLPAEEMTRSLAAIAPEIPFPEAPAHVWRSGDGRLEYLLWPAGEDGAYVVLVVDVAAGAAAGWCRLDAGRVRTARREPAAT